MQRRHFLFTSALTSLFSDSAHVSAFTQAATGKDPLRPFYLPPLETLQPGPTGLNIRTRVRHGQTNGQFSCVEFALAAKKMGPAPHLHKALDELMYVLDGTITVMVGQTEYQVQAGGWHLRPRGIVHTFWNATDRPAVGIDCYFQQPFEDFLESATFAIPEYAKAHGLSMDASEIREKYKKLHERFGLIGYPDKRQPIIEKYGLIA
ncbi:MAG: cupin [Dyadobacter sp. 50-39]|uniref:cupin domain-containing protein n=1 Tax=Dyadobacter sp. 50-39 TaxID=1895756 RepID=UPI000960509F|nr:cupin domain-containing protein [Dyadobacter sp. 50-39]OJV12582.1 MAG: cupin [Dyadobacter sp. 50-39]